jgi:hypothetical protein
VKTSVCHVWSTPLPVHGQCGIGGVHAADADVVRCVHHSLVISGWGLQEGHVARAVPGGHNSL